MPIRMKPSKLAKKMNKSRMSLLVASTGNQYNVKSKLESLLKCEEKYVLRESYFENDFQANIEPEMRTKLALWMLEICEEEKCTNEIYSLSMNLLDRLLSELKVELRHLQLLGCVCLSIASKSRLDLNKLCEYTDNSVTIDELINWQSLVLFNLNYDIKSIVANDFIDIILKSIGIEDDQIRYRCFKLTALCSTNIKYSLYSSSIIAIASILNVIPQLLSPICCLLKNFKCIDKDLILKVKDLVANDFSM